MKEALIILILFGMVAYSQVTEEWVHRYSGTEINGAADPNAMTIDNSGNVYVTGSAVTPGINGSVYVTIKYGNDGSVIWIKTYDGPITLTSVDIATDIAVDSLENVYITGRSQGNGFDYATIKYNSSGDELWVQRYSAGPFDDEASSIAVDPSGNVYVTGRTKASFSSTYIYTTLKYSPDGDQVWIASYDGPGNGNDWAKAIAADQSGNSYVTGQIWGENGNSDFSTIKYDPDGIQLWVKIYNGTENLQDIAESIAVDVAGNVYVTGWSHTFYTTIKYNSDGDQLWVQRYGTGESYDKAKAIFVDNSGNVYVTGESWGGSSTLYDYATIKYNPNGDMQWVSRYDGPINSSDRASALTVDNSGNVYVTGWSDSQGGLLPNFDFATVKYNPNGVEQWVVRYNGTGDGPDLAKALSIDGIGNVFITGSSQGEFLNINFVTIKYSQYPSSVREINSESPDKYSLSQNYPNPFNPSTVISYRLPVM